MEKELLVDESGYGVEEYQYQIALMKYQTAKYRAQIADYKLRAELDQKLCEAVSKRVGYHVDNSTIDTLKLPRAVWGEIMDELYWNKKDLIRPSHSILKYSLTRKKPELEQHIPIQDPHSPLEVLNNRSTSRAHEIINEYTADNTKRAYMGDIVYWQAWLSAAGFSFNESISEKEVISFVVQHVEGLDQEVDKQLVDQNYKEKIGPHKLSTVKRRIISLSIFLEAMKWNNPCQSKALKQLLSKLTKKYGNSKPSGKAITKDILDDMLDTCKKNTLLDIRDRALLLFAWGSGGRRRSEVVAADMKDLVRTPENEFVYTIPTSKTDQEGKGAPVPVKGRVAKALNDWLEASGITEGKIFRSAKKGGLVGGPLQDNAVYRIVTARLKKAGYNEKEYCAHSLRSGFVTEAGRRNKPLGDVMALTTHKNVNTVMKYYQSGSIINNSAANLAD